LTTLRRLGIATSYSRPSVSNDNPYSEALFKTLKYCPWYPRHAFSSLDAAKHWAKDFVNWYNFEHLHSGLKFITPADRHLGLSQNILEKRKEIYEQAMQKNPSRWSGGIRNWDLPKDVYLNPPKQKIV
jgi:putative transposase